MPEAPKRIYQFTEFTLDVDRRVLLRQGSPQGMAPKVFDTLLILIQQGGQLVTKEELMSRLWPDTFVEEGNLTFNIKELRKLLGDDARNPRFIETLPRRGYRFIAAVQELPGDSNVVVETPAEPQAGEFLPINTAPGPPIPLAPSHLSRSTSTKAMFAVAAIVLLAVSLGWLLWRRSPAANPASSGRLMLAVLPLKNLTGDLTQDYFSDGLTEEVISQLGNLDPQHLGIIARTSVMHYKDGRDSRDPIGPELGVQDVLEGICRRDDGKVRVTTQLIQIKDQSHLWAKEYDREQSHLLSLQDEIARAVAGEIQRTLGKTAALSSPHASYAPKSYEAYDLYLKGQYFWNKRTSDSLQRAIDYFRQATVKDPDYARAYAGLADSYALIGDYNGRSQSEFMPQARTAALRALELDDALPEAHTALALIVQNNDWDWNQSKKEFQRAIELNPNYATAHHWYAEHLGWLGRFDEALNENEKARQLDPLSLIIAADNGAILYYARRYDRAIAQFRRVRELDPTFPRAGLINYAYDQTGLSAEALADIEQVPGADDDAWYCAQVAYASGLSGSQPHAHEALQKLEAFGRRQPVDPIAMAVAYIGTGNRDLALASLEHACMEHDNLATLMVEPIYDPLRADPRFQELLRRVGFTP